MKKSISLCFLAALTALSMTMSAAERGKFIHVDNSSNKNLKPQLAFCLEHKDGKDITSLLLWTVQPNTYHEFGEAARILVAFADGYKVRLNRIGGSEEKRETYTQKASTATIKYYKSITAYETTPEVIEKLKNGTAITKVRVVFKENDAKDYEIAEGYQPKMAADLLKSYLEAEQKCKAANGDLSDDDF